MTLPVSGPISLGDVLTEIRRVTPSRALPISLGDADVRALAGKPSGPISLSDLYGKSSYIPMTLTATGDSRSYDSGAGAGLARGSLSVTVAGGSGGFTYLWEFTSGAGDAQLLASNTAICTVSRAYERDEIGSIDATLRCTVTDNTGHVAIADNVLLSLNWSPNL